VVLRQVQVNWRKQMCKEHKCFRKFIGSLNAESSQETYGYKMQKFVKYAVSEKLIKNTEDFDGLLEFDGENIRDNLVLGTNLNISSMGIMMRICS